MDSGDIETLSVRFHFLEESLAEIKNANQRLLQETQTTQDGIKSIVEQSHVDLKSMEDDYVKHRITAHAKETQEELKNALSLIDVQKRLVEASSANVSEKTGLLKMLNDDAFKLKQNIEEVHDRLSGLKTVAKETMTDLGISGSAIMEVGSIAGLIALAFMANDAMAKYGRSVAVSEAQSGNRLSLKDMDEMAGYIQQVSVGMHISDKDASGLVSGLLGIRGVSAEDIRRPVGPAGEDGHRDTWGERVAKMGMSIGEGPTGAIGMVKVMMDQLKIPMKGVEEEFDKVRKISHDLGDAHHEYMNTVYETAGSLKYYNVTVGTTSEVLGHFWQRIQSHDISLEQVTGLLKLGATESMGQLAYGGAMAAQEGSFELKSLLQGKSGIDQAETMKEILSGLHGDQAQKDMFQLYAQKAKGLNSNVLVQGKYLQSMTGMNFNAERPDVEKKTIDEMAAGNWSTETGDVTKRLQKGAATIDDILGAMKETRSPLDEIVRTLHQIAQIVGGSVLALAGIATIHPDWVRRGEEMVGANLKGMGLNLSRDLPYDLTGLKKIRAVDAATTTAALQKAFEEKNDAKHGYPKGTGEAVHGDSEYGVVTRFQDYNHHIVFKFDKLEGFFAAMDIKRDGKNAAKGALVSPGH